MSCDTLASIVRYYGALNRLDYIYRRGRKVAETDYRALLCQAS